MKNTAANDVGQRRNPNSEIRIPKEARNPNSRGISDCGHLFFGFRPSDFFRHSSFFIRHSLAGVIFLTLVTFPASARINLVTLPGRNSVQLTIYNSADLTLVKETRVLTFRKGLNRLEFSWANTLIDPTSIEFRALTHADEVEVLDVSFPPRVTNTLEWRINSEFAGEVKVEIRYFTSGITWSADYVAEANQAEKWVDLAGHVRVNNHSGEDYENAQIRLVVGVIRLIDEIAKLAQMGKPGAPQAPESIVTLERRKALMQAKRELDVLEAAAKAAPKEILKEGLSEYFLYTVEGRDTIAHGWARRLPSFKSADTLSTSIGSGNMKARWNGPWPRSTRWNCSHGTGPWERSPRMTMRLSSA